MSSPRLVAGLLVLGAAGAVAAALAPGPPLRHEPSAPCDAVVELDRVLDLASLGDQAVVRARAAALADALAQRASGDDPGAGDQAVVQRLLVLLEDPGATVADLVGVVQPVADGCGVTLQAAGS